VGDSKGVSRLLTKRRLLFFDPFHWRVRGAGGRDCVMVVCHKTEKVDVNMRIEEDLGVSAFERRIESTSALGYPST
jgi:hypothetical protein